MIQWFPRLIARSRVQQDGKTFGDYGQATVSRHQEPSWGCKGHSVLLHLCRTKCLNPGYFRSRTTSGQIVRPRNLVCVVSQVIHSFSEILHVHIRVFHIPSPFPSVFILECNQRAAPIVSHSTLGCSDSTLISVGPIVQEVIAHPHFERLLCFSSTNVILEEFGRCHGFVTDTYMFFELGYFEKWFWLVTVLSLPVAFDPYEGGGFCIGFEQYASLVRRAWSFVVCGVFKAK